MTPSDALEAILKVLEDHKSWGADTLDEIDSIAHRGGYGTLDDEGLFRAVPRDQWQKPRRSVSLRPQEAEYIHELLRVDKNTHTANGQVWILHPMNASLRTRLENL